METLQLDKEKALKAFREANDDGKKLLIELYGRELFPEKNAIKRITTLEMACVDLGLLSEGAIGQFVGEKHGTSLQAYTQLIVIADALNEGWVPNWNDGNEYKWYPWFKYNGWGFGFSGTGFGYTFTHACLGSRLVFKSQELAEHAGRTFESIYNDFLSI